MIVWRLLSALQTCFEFNMECQWHYWGALSRNAPLAEEYEKMAALRREYSRWKAGPQKNRIYKLHQINESQAKFHLIHAPWCNMMRAVGWLVMALGLLRYPSAVQVRWIAMPCLWQPRRLAWAVRCMCRVSSWIQRCWNRCDLDGGGFSAPTQKKQPKRWSREISVWKNGGVAAAWMKEL